MSDNAELTTPPPLPDDGYQNASKLALTQTRETTLKESLKIQRRVIRALLLREMITRYGRNNLGFLWLFVEPLLATMIIALVWGFGRGDHISNLNIVAFMVTGYPLLMMWRRASDQMMSAVSANIGLLYHRNVRVLDLLFSRCILEIFGATVAQIVILILFIFTGLIPLPADIFYMLMAWILMAFFAVGLGMILYSISVRSEVFGKIWKSMGLIFMLLSGVFYFASALPQQIREIVLWVPMIHGTEMFRHGYFGATVVTMENPWYLALWDIILLLVGLMAVNGVVRQGVMK